MSISFRQFVTEVFLGPDEYNPDMDDIDLRALRSNTDIYRIEFMIDGTPYTFTAEKHYLPNIPEPILEVLVEDGKTYGSVMDGLRVFSVAATILYHMAKRMKVAGFFFHGSNSTRQSLYRRMITTPKFVKPFESLGYVALPDFDPPKEPGSRRSFTAGQHFIIKREYKDLLD